MTELNDHPSFSYSRLIELGESDFELADHQPDIRGWDVKFTAGHSIGEVDEMIFNRELGKICYIVLELDGDAADQNPRKVLVPIGLAVFHDKEAKVVLPDVTFFQLSQLPSYEKGHLTPACELYTRHVFLGLGTTGMENTLNYERHAKNFYGHPHFNDDRFSRSPYAF